MGKLRYFLFRSACVAVATAGLAGCATTSTETSPGKGQGAAKTEPAAPRPSPGPTSEGAAAGEAFLLCPISITNRPEVGADGLVATSTTRVVVNGRALRLAPATNACFSSGFGARNGKPHQGIDYFSKTGGSVLAAAAGTIVLATTRSDYGNVVVIDHGDGVYTLYGHLEHFAPGVKKGAEIADGAVLGPIGSTGATTVRHLHFEIRTGTYKEPKGVFGLTAIDPMGQRRAYAGLSVTRGS